jgi:hypothetical protein
MDTPVDLETPNYQKDDSEREPGQTARLIDRRRATLQEALASITRQSARMRGTALFRRCLNHEATRGVCPCDRGDLCVGLNDRRVLREYRVLRGS